MVDSIQFPVVLPGRPTPFLLYHCVIVRGISHKKVYAFPAETTWLAATDWSACSLGLGWFYPHLGGSTGPAPFTWSVSTLIGYLSIYVISNRLVFSLCRRTTGPLISWFCLFSTLSPPLTWHSDYPPILWPLRSNASSPSSLSHFYLHSQLHLELPPILYLLSLLIPHSPHLPPYLVTMPKVQFPAHSLPWYPPLHYKEGRQVSSLPHESSLMAVFID